MNQGSTEAEATLRAQLTEACATLRSQIDVQNSVRFSRGGGYGGDDLAVQILQQKLDECEKVLVGINSREAGK